MSTLNLYEYVFWYNHYAEVWYAIPREEASSFFNNNTSTRAIKSSKIETLIELLSKPKLAASLEITRVNNEEGD